MGMAGFGLSWYCLKQSEASGCSPVHHGMRIEFIVERKPVSQSKKSTAPN